MVSIEYRKAISEVLEILKHTKKIDVDKISPNFLEFLYKNTLTNYEPHLDHSKSIKEMRLSDNTIAILSIIASKYWLTGENKENFENRLKENEEKYETELQQKYNIDNPFQSKRVKHISSSEDTADNTSIIKNKESIFTKIKNWFKRTF